MMKPTIWAVILIFVVWSLQDFLVHGVFLKSTYQETAMLWRAEEDMKMMLMSLVTLVFSICFVAIYYYLIAPKSYRAGIKFGMLLGVASGISMGLGSYCYMPIPLGLAMSWFVSTFIELLVAGIIVGILVKPRLEQRK